MHIYTYHHIHINTRENRHTWPWYRTNPCTHWYLEINILTHYGRWYTIFSGHFPVFAGCIWSTNIHIYQTIEHVYICRVLYLVTEKWYERKKIQRWGSQRQQNKQNTGNRKTDKRKPIYKDNSAHHVN